MVVLSESIILFKVILFLGFWANDSTYYLFDERLFNYENKIILLLVNASFLFKKKT